MPKNMIWISLKSCEVRVASETSLVRPAHGSTASHGVRTRDNIQRWCGIQDEDAIEVNRTTRSVYHRSSV